MGIDLQRDYVEPAIIEPLLQLMTNNYIAACNRGDDDLCLYWALRIRMLHKLAGWPLPTLAWE